MILNPNKEHVNKIKKALEKTGGYCPCLLERSEDTICTCKDMRENNICHCKLYIEE